ncbi:MAG: SIMPL domain-containing protein [candidate division Zixibacteria bacterium]|nr:SIMPL domain-containing protein [candidate division Zixibacteria bacterium]
MNSEGLSKIHSNLWLGVSLAIGLIVSTLIVANMVKTVKLANQTITVKGYSEKRIRSDFIVWKGSFTYRASQITEAYKSLSHDLSLVEEYLTSKGIPKDQITVSSISTRTMPKYDEKGRPTDEIASYELSQEVEIQSSEVDKVAAIAREATELINKGVYFQSQPPKYFYTKLSDLKVEMVASATKDARQRAEQLAVNSGCKVGSLRSATMGVFQITKAYSTEMADYGIYDTSTLEKDIKAVVTASFSIE